MGWVYLKSLGSDSDLKAYLDRLYKPVVSEQVDGVYYAALRLGKQVSALVCLLHEDADALHGRRFGYRTMHEATEPLSVKCPRDILERLTSCHDAKAMAWRERCRMQSENPVVSPDSSISVE